MGYKTLGYYYGANGKNLISVKLSPSYLLSLMSWACDDDSHEVDINNKYVLPMYNKGKRTVYRSIRTLEDNGLIEKVSDSVYRVVIPENEGSWEQE